MTATQRAEKLRQSWGIASTTEYHIHHYLDIGKRRKRRGVCIIGRQDNMHRITIVNVTDCAQRIPVTAETIGGITKIDL